MKKTAHVILSCDDNVAFQLSVALFSLLATHDFSRPLRVSVLNGGVLFSERTRESLGHIVERYPQVKFEIITVDALLAKYGPVLERKVQWPSIAWARCFISEIFPEEDGNIVYLDVDTLVAHDLSELYELSFARPDGPEDLVAAVCEDCREKGRTDSPWGNGIMPAGANLYCNSGVLVFNARAFREEGGFDDMLRWYAEWKDVSPCPDQDALNAVFWNRTRHLPLKFNYSDGWLERQHRLSLTDENWRGNPPREVLEAILDPVVLHYWGPKKPWKWNHRPEGRRYERVLRAVGLLEGALPGTTGVRRFVRALFAVYHAYLRWEVARRLSRCHEARTNPLR